MYAVIKTGGKQYRVEQGQQLQVELVGRGADEDGEIELTPVLMVDGDTVLAGPTALGTSKVTARVVGEARGPKITGFTYKPKTNNRRRWGHRQRYSTVEITSISMTGGAPPGRSATKAPAKAATKAPAKAATKAPAKAATKAPAKAAKKAPAKKAPAKAATKGRAKDTGKGTAKAAGKSTSSTGKAAKKSTGRAARKSTSEG